MIFVSALCFGGYAVGPPNVHEARRDAHATKTGERGALLGQGMPLFVMVMLIFHKACFMPICVNVAVRSQMLEISSYFPPN